MARLFGTCALAGLAANDFADKLDAFAFVRLGLAQRANLGAYLTQKLLVIALEDDQRVLVALALGLYLYLGGELYIDGVGVAECQLQNLACSCGAVTYAYEFHFFAVTFTHAYDHVVDQRTPQAALCAVLRMFDPSDVYVALIFECAVVLVSRFTDGYLFGLLASVIGVVGVNWIFTYPYMQLNFTISGYPLTFLVMLAVSVVVSALTTQIKQQEKLRAEAEREKMRGNLLRAVSHDIRTPLTAIVGGIDAILENGEKLSPETRTSLLENMRDESNWLIGVVENLLSVTRMSGASNIKKELEAGEEVLSAAAMKFQRHYPATRVEISAPDTLLMIPMDIILIEQVLINLMENAVQHGKTTTQISLRLTRSEDLAVFEVSDDGQGIAPALLPHLFDGYLTRDQEAISDKRRNMGIGLSVCYTIVKAHGGRITAENRPEGGAQFRFYLPLKEEKEDEDQG